MICKCPLGTKIPDIEKQGCAESFGQLQKVIFTRLKNGSSLNSISISDAKMKSGWTAKLEASDGTRVQISPYIQAPTTEGGAPITFGGGNETLGGIEEIIGREPTKFTGVIRKATQSVIKSLKAYECEQELGVYLVSESGAIAGRKVGNNLEPFPIRSFFVGDKLLGGKSEPDKNSVQFAFAPNWSDDFHAVETAFNPLSEL